MPEDMSGPFSSSEWIPIEIVASEETPTSEARAVVQTERAIAGGAQARVQLVVLRLGTSTNHVSARLAPAAARDLAERLLDAVRGEPPEPATRVSARPYPSEAPLPALGYLTILSGPDAQLVGRVYPLRGELVHLGRDSWNTVALNDPDVSRYHAILVVSERGHELHDFQSTNGTLLNAQKVNGTVHLCTGDTILAGSTALRYERA